MNSFVERAREMAEGQELRLRIATQFMVVLMDKQLPECPRCGMSFYDVPMMTSRSLMLADALIAASLKSKGER